MSQIINLGKLSMNLSLVQTEMKGTKHYSDGKGTRLILHIDGSFNIEQEIKK